jgi:hypothetical protein
MSNARELAAEVQRIHAQAAAEGRPLSHEEYVHCSALLDEAEAKSPRRKALPPIDLDQFKAPNPSAGAGRHPLDPGRAFVESQAYKSLFGAGATRPRSWSTGPIMVTDGPTTFAQYKGTLT